MVEKRREKRTNQEDKKYGHRQEKNLGHQQWQHVKIRVANWRYLTGAAVQISEKCFYRKEKIDTEIRTLIGLAKELF